MDPLLGDPNLLGPLLLERTAVGEVVGGGAADHRLQLRGEQRRGDLGGGEHHLADLRPTGGVGEHVVAEREALPGGVVVGERPVGFELDTEG